MGAMRKPASGELAGFGTSYCPIPARVLERGQHSAEATFAPVRREHYARRLPLLMAHADMLAWGHCTLRETVDYFRLHHFDTDELAAHAGAVVLGRVHFLVDGSFVFADRGEPAAVCEVIEYDDDNDPLTVDLAAWPLDHSARTFFATATGHGLALGRASIANPATYFLHGGLPVHRAPLAWLQARCTGAVILNPDAAGEMLKPALGPILAEDEAHALELRQALGVRGRGRILFPQANASAA